MSLRPCPAGEMDRKITIRTITQTRGSTYREPVQTPVTWANSWAKVTEVSGGEIYRGHQVSAEAAMLFEIRWRAGLLTTMEILYQGDTYDIVRISEIGRKVHALIEARGRVETATT